VFQRILHVRPLSRRWRFRPNELVSVDVPASRVHEVSDAGPGPAPRAILNAATPKKAFRLRPGFDPARKRGDTGCRHVSSTSWFRARPSASVRSETLNGTQSRDACNQTINAATLLVQRGLLSDKSGCVSIQPAARWAKLTRALAMLNAAIFDDQRVQDPRRSASAIRTAGVA
jgi:hypothetical protein